MNNRFSWYKIVLFGVLVLVVLVGGCIQKIPPEGQIQPAQPSKTSPDFLLKLSISGTSYLNNPVDLRVNVTSLMNAPNTTIHINLPEGVVVVNGDLNWNGNLSQEETIQLDTSIKAVKTGNWTIKATARSVYGRTVLVNTDFLYITVSETTATVSDIPTQTIQKGSQAMMTTNVSSGG